MRQQKNFLHQLVSIRAYEGIKTIAVEGYELDAVDYLVKPVSFERFVRAIAKLKRMLGQESVSQNNDYNPNPEAFVYLKVDKLMQKVLINEITYIESWKDYIKLFQTNGKTLLVKQPISAMENLLSEHKFLRVHRSYLVSVNKISGYSALAVQVQATEIPIGRLYKQAVMSRLQIDKS